MRWVEVAEATTWTGEAEVDPVVGELTVTPAKDAEASVIMIISDRTVVFTGMYSFRARVLLSGGSLEVHLLWMYQESS